MHKTQIKRKKYMLMPYKRFKGTNILWNLCEKIFFFNTAGEELASRKKN